MLVLVLLVGGLLRLWDLPGAPPGLNQDEASNAWNAYCMLKTGQDQSGTHWPVFYTRAFGENRSTLFLYWMMPFQAIGGLNVWTTRLPSAVGGILTLLLIYSIGRQFFGRAVGLVASGLLAICPWHIQQCRWGHEAAIVPLLISATLAMMLWANLPVTENRSRPARPWIAFFAGLMAGISCYGYPAIRIFLPLWLAAGVLVTWRNWWQAIGLRSGRIAVMSFLAGGLLTFGPLVWKHVTDSANINRRLNMTRAWVDGDSQTMKIRRVISRYPYHFGPTFLFTRGDVYAIQSPPGSGQFQMYMLPLMLVGLWGAIRSAGASMSSRWLLVWLLVYPVGDCLSRHMGTSPHALRSLPGLGGFILLAAWGLVWMAARLNAWRPKAVPFVGVLFLFVVLGFNVQFVSRFFGEYTRQSIVYHNFAVDLMEACDWLRSRLDEVDAVFCTTTDLNEPYAAMMVGLSYDPHRWFSEPRETKEGVWEFYRRIGKIHFVYDNLSATMLDAIKEGRRPATVVLIARPNEIGRMPAVRQIVRPDGEVMLRIIVKQY